ncbi:MAG: glycoside hydrolase family 2 protein, partial [Lachnospiraceae bacterium]|nr:glycoside hydrolase family 2 protein [Lachnospiraceae bacterium]
MTEQHLHENWKMCQVGTDEFLPAAVPGSVYADLLANGRMEDPYYRDNEEKALSIMSHDFEYLSVFDAGEDILNREEVLLHFDGIDTVADIYLNDSLLGHTENMHR